MDLLCKAYSTTASSDDEPEDQRPVLPPPSKRSKTLNPLPLPTEPPIPGRHVLPPPSKRSRTLNPLPLPTEPPIPGRYVSKRERAVLVATLPHPNPPPSPTANHASSPVVGSLSDSDLPHDILTSLRRQLKGHAQLGQRSERRSVALNSHSKAVNVVQWSTCHAHLLASAGMDHSICIWNVWSRDQKKARVLNYHTAAVKDVKWSQQGLYLLSCGYDCSSRLIDVEKGLQTQIFEEDQVVGVIKFCPDNPNIFLSGGSKGFLRLWDIRTGKVVNEYIRGLGPILDVEFTNDAKQFISSSDASKSNVSENSIIVWDVSRQVPLSNQVYVEAYTCPCIRCHPFDPYFVAQSNGNYIAIFSSKPPFKLDKYRRYESHGVSGFPIKCNFSLDGERLVSGSSDGCIYFYNSRSSQLIEKIKVYEEACIDVVFHPILPNVVASCSWKGNVSVLE
ncbi:uncharacterized protein LOC132307774 [Cornus florida]|uniref:uncharacterized protein LOC132307774 n=1 Tax=Cornus florida TaxID=4283 RepID=UPI0028971AE7|nr:uncharacterized protein LOC132307774 [Cornus florida]